MAKAAKQIMPHHFVGKNLAVKVISRDGMPSANLKMWRPKFPMLDGDVTLAGCSYAHPAKSISTNWPYESVPPTLPKDPT